MTGIELLPTRFCEGKKKFDSKLTYAADYYNIVATGRNTQMRRLKIMLTKHRSSKTKNITTLFITLHFGL